MIKFPGFGQRNNKGPPDLDEVFRDLSKKINGLFGRSNQDKGGSPTNFELPVAFLLGIAA